MMDECKSEKSMVHFSIHRDPIPILPNLPTSRRILFDSCVLADRTLINSPTFSLVKASADVPPFRLL